MQLTKLGHACVRFDDGDRALVVDPGVFTDVGAALDGVRAMLVTHEHPDHIDVDAVGAALAADSRLRLYGPSSVTALVPRFGEQVVALEAGSTTDIAGFEVRAFGGQHALIHPLIPMVANLAYLVNGAVYHPGDSFTVPDAPVPTLLLPTNAPWSKAGEVIDFAIAVRAPRVHQIHDGLVNDRYVGIVEGHLARLAAPYGVGFTHLADGDSVTPD